MKKIYLSMICAASLLAAQAQTLDIATFEDLDIAAESYWNGADSTAMFISGGYMFINNYVDYGGGFSSWDGFAYANFTSTSYTSLADQYNCCVGHGVDGSQTYGVGYYSTYMGTEPIVTSLDVTPYQATGCYVTNAAYAYTSMLNGDSYSKKFDDTDWFLLTATGYLDMEVTGTAQFYLAKEGKIVNDWQYFDLSALGQVDEIHFTLSSSDNGDWGMNTPAYFCIDNFGAEQDITRLNELTHSHQQQGSYDLQGRRLGAQQQGLTINNGKVCFVR